MTDLKQPRTYKARSKPINDSSISIRTQKTKIIHKQTDHIANIRNKFICGNAIEVMRTIPNSSIDLVITSPPYNLKNSTGNGRK